MAAEQIVEALSMLAKLIEIIGAFIMVAGFIVATIQWLRQSVLNTETDAEARYRKSLGRVILIGLELLVAATIIKTITVKFNVEGMGLLVFMVIIRIILGWATFLEINGRWPWQKPRRR